MPDYPKLAQLWWQAIGDASSGAKTAQEAMDSLCAEQEKVMARLEKAGVQGDIGPKLADEHDLAYWNATPTGQITVFDHDPERGPVDPRALVRIPEDAGHPDGLTVDAEGGIWTALNGGSAELDTRPSRETASQATANSTSGR